MAHSFVHCADLHIDSPLHGLRRQEGAVPARLARATRDAFEALVEQAIEEAVDFLVIAGDLYDGDWPDANTGIWFVGQMGRLQRAGIPVFVLRGNHDAENRMTRHLTLPDNVTVFSHRKAETLRIDDLRVALHGRSFAKRDETADMVPDYPPAVAGWLNIGVLHSALEGNPAHSPYAPTTLAALQAKGYHYWALGHVHQRQVLSEEPWVVFPGNLQGRHVRETGAKGYYRVHFEGEAVLGAEFRAADVVRWAEVSVDITGIDNLARLWLAIREALEAALGNAEGRPLAARIAFVGRGALHGQLLHDRLRVEDEVLAAAAALGEDRVWIEKLRFATEPLLSEAAVRERGDALGDLARLLGQAAGDPDLLAAIEGDLALLRGKLPRELAEAAEDPLLQTALEGEIARLIDPVGGELVARLARADRGE